MALSMWCVVQAGGTTSGARGMQAPVGCPRAVPWVLPWGGQLVEGPRVPHGRPEALVPLRGPEGPLSTNWPPHGSTHSTALGHPISALTYVKGARPQRELGHCGFTLLP